MSAALHQDQTPQDQTHKHSHNNVLITSRRNAEIEELDAAIGRLSRHMNACNYQLMLMLREFDERAGWLKWGFTDAVHWLCWRCDLSAGAARDKMRVAHALKELEQMSKAFERGVLSYSKVRALTRIATPENEEELIELAKDLSVVQVEAHCRQRINTKKESTKSANNAHNNRALRLWKNEGVNKINISIELTVEEGELFQKALEKAALRYSVEQHNAPNRVIDEKSSWSALQADAAMMIVREFLSGQSDTCTDGTKASSADLYQVVVHVDEEALTGDADKTGSGTCSSEMPIGTVRRLCCDGSIIPIVESAKGEPLSVGRKVRTITTGIRRALWARDKGCVFPGCHCKRYVDAHHIKHWADGGETSLDNLLLLCTRHHRLVHEGGYSIERDHNQQHFFRRPDGIAVPVAGYRLDDWQDDWLDDWQDDFSDNLRMEDIFSGGNLVENSREFSGYFGIIQLDGVSWISEFLCGTFRNVDV